MAGGVSSPEGRAPDERSQPAPSGGLPQPVAVILWLLVVGAFGAAAPVEERSSLVGGFFKRLFGGAR